MRLIVLASGSSGNAAIIESGGRAVLLDAGISARETLRRISAATAVDARIEAILLTHEHVDHVRGARVLARNLGIPIIGTTGTLQALATTLTDVPDTATITRRDHLSLAGMRITSFPTAHDAAESCGYSFESRRGHRIAITTDTGVVTPEALEALTGAHVIGIEANHDPRMLDAGPYPPFLKRRIAGSNGHLSNEAAAQALRSVVWSGLSQVFALHISEQNNTPETVRETLAETLAKQGTITLETVARGEIAGCTL
ncbi:MAG: MBL fold metallo-hydrolase [Coriobacteriia bacterium]|nr:MBL fold metallo-hydrolase [Coriobacteriia bacterium]